MPPPLTPNPNQLRSLASEHAPPSPVQRLDESKLIDDDFDLENEFASFDFRNINGLQTPPDQHFSNPEYLKMEMFPEGELDNLHGSLPEDDALADDLATAAAIVKRNALSSEVRDALYLSIAHKFNACGVPLVVDPTDYGGALPSVRPNRHSRHPLGKIGVVGALERAVTATPGQGDASARRRRRRFAEKTRRLLREMLPDGSETLLYDHLEQIVRDANASARAIDTLREEGTKEGLTAAHALARSASLARVYRRSAQYGYFLRAAEQRVVLEKCAVGELDDETIEDRALSKFERENHGKYHGTSGLRVDRRRGLRTDAASMWLRAARGDAGMSTKADMASLASNVVGPLPAYPSSVGDWVEPIESTTAWLHLEAPEESWRSMRRRRRKNSSEREKAAAANGNGSGAYHEASIGDWIAEDDEGTLSDFGDDTAVFESGINQPDEDTKVSKNIRGRESSQLRQVRFASDSDVNSVNGTSSVFVDNANPIQTKPPSLSKLIDSMDASLRMSLFQISGKETKTILNDHVDALFGLSNKFRSEKQSEETHHVNPNPNPKDAVFMEAAAVHATPIDALRYLVTEAAAFGAQMHAAEKLGERFDLVRNARDA